MSVSEMFVSLEVVWGILCQVLGMYRVVVCLSFVSLWCRLGHHAQRVMSARIVLIFVIEFSTWVSRIYQSYKIASNHRRFVCYRRRIVRQQVGLRTHRRR